MQQPNSQFQSPSDDVDLARYYNDALIGIEMLYETAAAGSCGAKVILRDIAERIVIRAAAWRIAKN